MNVDESMATAPRPDDPLHLALDAEQVVERYLLGRLEGDEADRFEQHYLDCPVCLERLEVGEGLVDGLRQAAVEDTTQVVAGFGLARLWAALGARRSWLLAASLLAVVPMILFGWRTVELGDEVDRLRQDLAAAQSPRSDLWHVALAPERGLPGDAPSRQLRLPAEPRLLMLTFELGLPPGRRATLTQVGGTGPWSQTVVADPAGHLVVAIPTTTLTPGDLSFDITDEAGDPIARIPLRVLGPS